MRRRVKVISGLAVAGAAAGLATLVAVKVRANHAEVTFNDGHVAVATVMPTGDVQVESSEGQPTDDHMHAAAVVAVARVPRAGNALWHALRGSLDDLLHRPSTESAETTAGVGLQVLESEGLAVKLEEPSLAKAS